MIVFLARRKFDPSSLRSTDAALQFSEKRRAESTERICPTNIKNSENGPLQVVNSKQLHKYSTDKVLVCQNFKTKPLNEFKTCNFDATMPAAVSFHHSSIMKLELIRFSSLDLHQQIVELIQSWGNPTCLYCVV